MGLPELPEPPDARALQSLACLQETRAPLRGTLLVRSEEARHRQIDLPQHRIG